MGITIQTSKKLITKKRLFFALLITIIVLLSQSAKAALPATWWSSSESLTQSFRDNVITLLDEPDITQKIYNGHQYIIFQGVNVCHIFVTNNINDTISISDTSTTAMQYDISDNYTRVTYGGIGSTPRRCGIQTNAKEIQTSSPIKSYSQTIDYIVASNVESLTLTNGTTPVKTVQELNSLKITIPFTPDPNWYNNALQYERPYLHVPVAGSNVGESHPCKPQTTIELTNWYSLLEESATANGGNTQTIFNRLKSVVLGEEEGGWTFVTDVDETSGYATAKLFVYYGNPTLTWEEPTTEYPNGRVYIPTSQTTNEMIASYSIFCSTFNSNGHGVTITTQNTTQNFRIDKFTESTSGGGNWCESPACVMNRRTVFMSGNYDPNYPEGYTGIEILDRPHNINDNTFADFELYTNGTTIRASFNGHEYMDPKCNVLYWQYANAETPYEIEMVVTKIHEDLNITLKDPGTYRLNLAVDFIMFDLSGSGLNDADQPYCFGKYNEIQQLYQQGKLPLNTGKIFPVNLLDSEYFANTEGRVCSMDYEKGIGFYNPTMLCEYATNWQLANCSTYSFVTELDQRMPCEIENFFKRLWSLFITFFVPNPAKLTSKVQALQDSANIGGNVGQIPIQLITATYTASVSATPTCTFIANGATFNFCSVNTINNDVFNMIKFVVNFTIIITFAYAVWRFLNSIFGGPTS